MKPTNYSYDEIKAYMQYGRTMRAHYIREFFRGLFAKAKPAEVIGAQTQTC